MAPGQGLEPRPPESESGMLPITPARYMVRKARLELARPCGPQVLNLVRLPFRHMRMVLAKGVEPLIHIGDRA